MKDEGMSVETMAVWEPQDKEERKLPKRDFVFLVSLCMFIVFGVPLILHFCAR